MENGNKLMATPENIRIWRERNRERYLAYRRKWRTENIEKERERTRKWQKDNPEKIKEYVQKNMPLYRKSSIKWRKNNPDRVYSNNAKRRALKKSRHSEPYNRLDVLAENNSLCWICKTIINVALPPRHRNSFSIDHVIPLVKGGDDVRSNVAPAHLGCNSSKGVKVLPS